VVGAVTGLAMVLLAGAGEADAYVRYQTSTGTGFAWMPSCLPLPIVVYPDTFSQLTGAEITSAATGAAAAWSAGANPCTFIELAVTVASGPTARAGNDARNSIIFRGSSWCRLDPTGACDPTIAYDPAALALTSVSARMSTGAIIDADIEINAFHFQWADGVAHPELTGRHDLQNALTHEIGHVLGLDHSCSITLPPPNDHTGQPVPDCATATASVRATTMFPSANPGDVEKRTLEPDDRAGVCGIYPAAATPCPPGADCTCPPAGTDAGQDAGGGGPDAAPADALPADAPATDAGKTASGGGCGCAAGGRSAQRSWPELGLLSLAVALGAIVRRRELPKT
jgi:MYXO-CTERM domain-containing protein